MTTTANISQMLNEWCTIFPRQVTENYTSSVTFMKQLTVVVASTITYLKNVFPEESYMMETFAGIKLKILKQQCRDETAQFLITALEQAFEAFDKKFLHQLALCFYENECKLENLIEYYVFEYLYNSENGVTLNIHSHGRDSAPRTIKCTFDSVREKTVNLIRACVIMMQTYHREFPQTFDISIRLYYNSDAPEGYQAPGFVQPQDSEDHLEFTLTDSIKLGTVETPFHTMTGRSYIRNDYEPERRSREVIPSLNPPAMNDSSMEQDNAPVNISVSDTNNELKLQCPCNNFTGETPPFLTCQYCMRQQHAVCFGILPRDVSQVAVHCCVECYDMDNTRAVTDQKLIELSGRKRECFCILRRTLVLCCELDAITGRAVIDRFGLSYVSAAKLMKLLYSIGVISKDSFDLVTTRKVYHDRLQLEIKKFFQIPDDNNTVDRLLAKTLNSQEITPDPIGDVLHPLEKMSIQNNSNITRLIEKPEDFNKEKVVNLNDTTLKEYHEAVLSNERVKEELPLSGSRNPMKEVGNLGKKKNNKRKKGDDDDYKPTRTGVKTKRTKMHK